MPLYEYQCAKGHRSSVWKPHTESSIPEECPTCGEVAHKVVSLFSVGIKLVHKAVGDDERIASKLFKEEADAHSRAVEARAAQHERNVKEGIET